MNIAFKLNNPLAKYIRNAKTNIKKRKKSGVYKLTCGSCHKIYTGQTGRSFKVRRQEYYRSVIKEKEDSNYAQHLLVDNHQYNEKFDILHIEGKGWKLNLLESLEIY